jgi:predicted GNAT family acetyltransferase
MTIVYRDDLAQIDWREMKSALAADDFANGRTPEQLKTSFQNSQGACIAWFDLQIVGTARVLSDGVCNAYLVDVWTLSSFRRQGIAREMVHRLCTKLAGQHVYLQADSDVAEVYRRLGFAEQPLGMSRVIGRWLINDPDPSAHGEHLAKE